MTTTQTAGQATTMSTKNKRNATETTEHATPEGAADSTPVLPGESSKKESKLPLFDAYTKADKAFHDAEAAVVKAKAARMAACRAIYEAAGPGPFMLKGRGIFLNGATIRTGKTPRGNQDQWVFRVPNTETNEEIG